MQATRLHIHNIRVHMHCPCAFIVMCELASADSQYMAASTYIECSHCRTLVSICLYVMHACVDIDVL